MKNPRLVLGIASLVALFVLQFGYWQWQRRPLSLLGPTTNQAMPTVHVEDIVTGANDVLFTKRSSQVCILAVFSDVGCPHCQHLRTTFARVVRKWRDSVELPVRVMWLARQSRDTLNAFYAGYDFKGIEKFRVSPQRNPTWLNDLGIIGTPIMYLIDGTGTLRFGVAGSKLPPADSARAICATKQSRKT